MDLTTATDLGRVHKWMDESQPDLLVLGPLTGCEGLAEQR